MHANQRSNLRISIEDLFISHVPWLQLLGTNSHQCGISGSCDKYLHISSWICYDLSKWTKSLDALPCSCPLHTGYVHRSESFCECRCIPGSMWPSLIWVIKESIKTAFEVLKVPFGREYLCSFANDVFNELKIFTDTPWWAMVIFSFTVWRFGYFLKEILK